MKKLMLPVLLLALAFASCQKQKQNIQVSNNGSTGVAMTKAMLGGSGINPENPNNPDDSVGYYHNQLVSYLFQKGYGTSTSEDSLMKWTNQFMSAFMGVANFEQIADTPVFQAIIGKSYKENNLDSLINGIESDYNSGEISKQAHDFMLSVVSVINSIPDNLVTPSLIQDKIDAVKNIEDTIVTSSMSRNDKLYVLAQTSVCRYSLSYWYGYYYGNSSNSLMPFSISKAAFKNITGADIRGAALAMELAEYVSIFNPAGGVAILVAAAATFSANEALHH